MDIQQMIADFEARGGTTTVVPPGRRVTTERDMRRIVGWQPDTLTVFTVDLIQETGEPARERLSCESEADAWREARRLWPECQIVDVGLGE